MYKIKTMNKITKQGLDIFAKDKYQINDTEENPEAIIVRSASLLDMNLNSDLKAIARAGAGYNNVPVDRCTEAGIIVFTSPGANANAVKELAVASIIMASRNILDGVNWAKTLTKDVAKEVEVGKSKFVGHEIHGKSLGIIGVGSVGSLTANAGVALGMDVLGVDPYMTVETAMTLSRSVKRAYDNETIFKKSDYIVLHAILTSETKNMINKDSIAQMKEGVNIINLSRAELVNDDDMAEALESGKVGAYVTDFPNEKVLKMKNAIPIPHLGASTPESEENCAIMAVNQIVDYLENGNIKNSVNYPDLVMSRNGDIRICILHKNVSGVISNVTTVLSGLGINITNFTNRSKGDNAYTICEIDGELPEGLIEALSNISEIIRINVIR